MPHGDYDRQREPFPATPFLFLQDRITNPEWSIDSWMIWNTETVNTQDFKYVTGESKIFILTSGYYEIIYELSVFMTCDSEANDVKFVLYKNGNIILGSKTAVGGTTNSIPITCHYYMFLNRGDYLQLGIRFSGTCTLHAIDNTIRFIIKGMDMVGWNNAYAGARNIRKDVM